MADIAPEHIIWVEAEAESLFGNANHVLEPVINKPLTVNKNFIAMAEIAACYREVEKWDTLYRILWRLQHDEKHLLKISVDPDIEALNKMIRRVRRDSHKMKAFVRFRQVGDNDYIAWHEPQHYVLRRTAPFFSRRFSTMNWAILTPDESVSWDGNALSFSDGVPRSQAPAPDAMEEMWKTFYRNIFNPARIKTKMMKSEMPVKYWHTMPETALIPSMLEEADARVKKMLEAMPKED